MSYLIAAKDYSSLLFFIVAETAAGPTRSTCLCICAIVDTITLGTGDVKIISNLTLIVMLLLLLHV
jgi:hypothetical protein